MIIYSSLSYFDDLVNPGQIRVAFLLYVCSIHTYIPTYMYTRMYVYIHMHISPSMCYLFMFYGFLNKLYYLSYTSGIYLHNCKETNVGEVIWNDILSYELWLWALLLVEISCDGRSQGYLASTWLLFLATEHSRS